MSFGLNGLFQPKSIAVIGASTRKGSIGHTILHNLIQFEFNGKVFPVNPKARVIHSMKCYPRVLDVPDDVDLAVIVVPRDFVLATLEECGQKGVKGVVVITSGFKEVGGEGVAREEELLETVRRYGMRMIGPNCFGILNTDPDVMLNATFSKTEPLSGKIGFMSQSGALGEAILAYARDLNLGFSMFASVGNKADISGNDLLSFWKDDPSTGIILLYLESFGAPRVFTSIARGISRKKPIIAVKAGRTDAGARAVSSHTGVLAGLDVGVDALFEQCGVQRVTSIDELFDVAMAFSNQPIPQGERVAIITNAGGPGILATDAIISLGLKIARFEEKTLKKLRDNLPETASVNNPVDVIASGGPEAYRVSMDAVLSDKNVDAVIVIFVPPVVVDHEAVINGIVEVTRKHKNSKTVLGCFMAVPGGITGSEEMIKYNIPVYTFPESAAKALSSMVRYRKWLERPEGNVVKFDVNRNTAEKVFSDAVECGREIIVGQQALAILDAYRISTSRSLKLKMTDDLEAAIADIGLPLIMKIDDPKIVHKTDQGGVSGVLESNEDVFHTFEQMRKKFNDGFSGVILQEYIEGEVETIIGMNTDPSFGPLIMFGLGGIYVEVMKDVTFKVHPVTDYDASEMIKSIKGYPLMTGFRGTAPVDLAIIEQTILKLSQLVTDFPILESFDLNPFIAAAVGGKSAAVDARFVLKR